MNEPIPVVTLDGPGGAGKGTMAQAIARHFNWHFLDSGAIYRIFALHLIRSGLEPDDGEALAAEAQSLKVEFPLTGAQAGETLLDGEVVSRAIRTEACGAQASVLAAEPAVRAALLQRQRAFRQPPGLVADGRDMGTVVFPDATVKIFLTASVEERARRRHKQLMGQGVSANLADLLQEMRERDRRDMNRSEAPLVPADDAFAVDTTELTVEAAIEQILSHVIAGLDAGAP
ncbi:(d)CMP kinase [Spiribacter sp. 2438]|uniref:(d)CMP kinase n=1 Tax=Spiribacter sp. 2438 TaxID=2666185 RepID=UPI0012AEF8D7|nr:(d)CMP kinase [Spiribacter sp. 2438]QGM21401.1 (d)CMP kinase [Spiribacter sp. 2438]